MDKILVATDGSEGADRAIDFAAQLAKDAGARLLIVNVVGTQSLPDAVFNQFSRSQNAWFHELLDVESARILKAAAARAREKGITEVQLESGEGDVAGTILSLGEAAGADVFVVGKRGAGRVGGLLLGSVSQKLVSLASKVAIVVP